MDAKKYNTLSEFWPYYVTQHSHPLTRWLHFVGTNNLIGLLLLAAVRRSLKLFVIAVMSSYAYAWVGHLLVERNRPATWEYPVKSAICELAMYVKIWQGTMDAEVKKYCDE